MPYNAVAKPAVTVEQILLTNLMTNPVNGGGVVPPCFTYQERTFSGTTWVIGVAIMTTVRSQQRDQNTGDFQRVTKALLNVSPRNVVAVWQNASLNNTNRMQPLPASSGPHCFLEGHTDHASSETGSIRRAGDCARHGAADGAGCVSGHRFSGDGGPERGAVEHELYLDVAGSLRCRIGSPRGGELSAVHVWQPTAASATDPFASYDMTVSPVRFNGREVVLSSDPAFPSNYPAAAVVAAFAANSVGNLNVNGAPVAHAARARLMSMSTVTDFFTQQPVTLQTWEITGVADHWIRSVTCRGRSDGRTAASPVFSYAAFATHHGCNALSFAGGADTHSYDSAHLVGGMAVLSNRLLAGTSAPTATSMASAVRRRSTARSPRRDRVSAIAHRTM